MTISNVIGGFKKTGVFPLDRGAIKLPKDSMEKLPGESGLSFIPLYTPSKSYKANFSTEEMRKNQLRFESGYDVPNERYEMWLAEFHPEVLTSSHNISLSSSSDEDSDDSIWFSSDFDENLEDEVQGRLSRQEFKRLSHRRSSSCPRVQYRMCSESPHDLVRQLRSSSSVRDLQNVFSPPAKRPAPCVKSSARAMTSSECLRLLQEKEDKKKHEALMKLQRKQQREEKKQKKEELQRLKELERRKKEEQRQQLKLQKEEQKRQKEEQKRQREEQKRQKEEQKRQKEEQKWQKGEQKRQTKELQTQCKGKAGKGRSRQNATCMNAPETEILSENGGVFVSMHSCSYTIFCYNIL